MEYDQVAMHADGLVRGYFNIAAQTMVEAGYTVVDANYLKNTIMQARELFKPEYHAVFDSVFAQMVEDIEELHQRGLN